MLDKIKETIGMTRLGVYLPDNIETSADIADKTGIPLEVVREKMGLRQKHVAGPDEHVSDMALAAARDALKDFDPAALDAVIFFGSQYKDYPVWSCACKLQHELGAEQAFATEIYSLCAGFTVALRMVKGLMLSDDTMNNVLLTMGSKESYLIDYKNPRVRFMYNFGDGGAAVLLQKGAAKNLVLETHNITAGFFSKHVKVLDGGSVNPVSSLNCSPDSGKLDVIDPEEMKEYLDPITFDNFIDVVRIALEKSGKTMADLDFLAPIHFKRSLYSDLLRKYGLTEEQSFYLQDYGHVQAADQIIALTEAEKLGRLKDGDTVALLAAGTGYTWGSTIIQWGNAS